MSDPIDRMHFQELAAMDPDEVCRRADCRYDPAEKKYAVRVWDRQVHLFPQQARVESTGGSGHDGYDYIHFVALHYLLGATATAIAHAWISPNELPGGTTFFRGPHAIPTDRITRRFANDLDAFRSTCEQLNGTPISMADAAWAFQITPRIPLAVLYWQGDDEFPPEAKLLYDRTIGDHLALDGIYALSVGICRRLGNPDTTIA